ncbi:AAA family ATPase [Roseateles toxinivorans]|uniref:Cell division protease FtsH n=1 Tax=Roseateles toxinivorans TaxID=270368 RepID=A0A4R6QM22_9BURK|nr:AAA family ATPase [Roseateles toxinivorans]TDP71539.1 cell division protease FtsH [Roseateles toxinivorans]
MTPFKKLLKRTGAQPRVFIALVAAALLLASLSALYVRAQRESDARKSPEARQFEQAPDDWLDHEHTVSHFRRALDGGNLSAVGLANAQPGLVLYTLKSGEKASATVPGCTAQGCAGTALDRLGDKSAEAGFALVSVNVDPRTGSRRLLDWADKLLSPLLLVGTLVAALILATKLQTGMGGAASKLSARPQTQFADVIGSDEAKAGLTRVKAFMHDPAQYARLGASAPRGVLLVGPPGTGKTLLAKALAGESKANFIAVDGSYFTAMFYGAGVAKVKDLFKLARKNAPCVLFIDEVDGIGKRSTGGSGGGAESELNRIINRVLVEMDGFESLDNVVVVAATNHEDNVDPAMRRPGRFDMLVRLTLPTLPDRQQLFDLYIGKLRHDGTADTAALARMTAGLSPADIANTVNKAASSAAEAGAQTVSHEHLLRAIETHQLGGEVSAIKGLLSESTRERLAYHEAGHALVGHWLDLGAVERVTIEPRGQALGVTYISRGTEDPLYAQAELSNRLAMMLGGREAELLVKGSVSSGASDDLKRASELAINMVGSLGFSKTFGLLSVAGVPKELLGPDIQSAVLKEARAMLEQAQAQCQQLLTSRRWQLDALAQALLHREVLCGDELNGLLAGGDGPLARVESFA